MSRLARLIPPGVRSRLRFVLDARAEPEIRLIRALLPSNGVLIDVGANRGMYVNAAPRGCTVIAVEPQPLLAAALRTQWRTHRRVTVVESALSPAAGLASLYLPLLDGSVLDTRASLAAGANAGYDHDVLKVSTRTLDSLTDLPVDVVKIDVEGFEAQVLESARETLLSDRPAVMVEVEARHHPDGDPWRAFEILAGLGYQGWFILRGELHPLAGFEPATHQPVGVVKDPRQIGRPDGLVNNFLFTHPERHDEFHRYVGGR